ncbi:MAG: hypothetical protein IBJ03_01760 [Gemmatimonadaceae bacterium]|nr:hypothetical protein [Gemmatimonadaceae bacterium]
MGESVSIGTPIGPLTSRLIANVALAELDRYVESDSRTITYRRYVDDVVVVSKVEPNTKVEVKSILPLTKIADSDVLDSQVLKRSKVRLMVNARKTRLHVLEGRTGVGFLDTVIRYQLELASQRRSFVPENRLLTESSATIARSISKNETVPKTLREIDERKLEKYAINTAIIGVSNAAILIDRAEANQIVRRAVEHLLTLARGSYNWPEFLAPLCSLLEVAVSLQLKSPARQIVNHFLGTEEGRSGVIEGMVAIQWANREIANAEAQKMIRSWVKQRLKDAISIGVSSWTLKVRSSNSKKSRQVLNFPSLASPNMLRRQGNRFLRSGISHRTTLFKLRGPIEIPRRSTWGLSGVTWSHAMEKRIGVLRELAGLGRRANDPVLARDWISAILHPNPPSYFAVAMLVWSDTKTSETFVERLWRTTKYVNALRGTKYRSPDAKLDLAGTVSLPPSVRNSTSEAIRYVLANLETTDASWKSSLRNPSRSLDRLLSLSRTIDSSLECQTTKWGDLSPMLILLPELSLPRTWVAPLGDYITSRRKVGLVAGIEYLVEKSSGLVTNQAVAILPGPYKSASFWSWRKRAPAQKEKEELAKEGFRLEVQGVERTLVLDTEFGRFSVLVCSEIIDTKKIADVVGRAEVLLVPAWNQDTTSFDHMTKSVGLATHTIVCVANNRRFSDCRAWAPLSKRYEQDLCRLIERTRDGVIVFEPPISSLRDLHETGLDSESIWKPLPPGWMES